MAVTVEGVTMGDQPQAVERKLASLQEAANSGRFEELASICEALELEDRLRKMKGKERLFPKLGQPHVAALSIAYQHELDEIRDHYSTDEDFAEPYDALVRGEHPDSYSLKDGFLMFRGKLCVSRLLRQKREGLWVTSASTDPYNTLESIAMDFIFGLPKTSSGNEGIWTIVDWFSKQAHFIPVRKQITTEQMAKTFLVTVFKYHEMPRSIVSDRDPRMIGLFWRALWQNLHSTLRFSSSYHPQTDGQSEMVNSAVLDLLKCYVSNNPAQWEHFLPLVEFASTTPFIAPLAKRLLRL
ncbi:hypothetical protein L7F22_028350 [Adiantum nelumboides]|nr:hypothetical protein [Adiantum nelumboides]